MELLLTALLELAIVERSDTEPNQSIVSNSVNSHAPDVKPAVTPIGELLTSNAGLDAEEPQIPKYQPPLFRKALAFALSGYLSGAADFSDENLALFLAEPDQAGVPASRAYPREVTNHQAFLKADAIQVLNHPSYSTAGDSYFEYLSMYLRNVAKKESDPRLAKARAELLEAKRLKDIAYERAQAEYASSIAGTPASKISFIEKLNADQRYIAAWQKEADCEKAYTSLQDDSMRDLSRQLDQIKSADDRLAERVQNNMPCIAVSHDYIHDPEVMAGGKLKVDPKDVYYRPFYSLPDLETRCNDWQSLNVSSSTTQRYGPVQISLLDVVDRSWSEIGHEGLDKAKAAELTPAQIAMLGSLRIALMFVGKPAVIDVDRGFWDVPHVRRKLPHVADSLPPALQRKFCKTVKMMFAWNIEITIRLASGAQVSTDATTPAPSLGDLNLSFLKLGLAPDASKADELKFVSGSPPYPLLLAVLAQTV